ncbi:MAG: hypothetical protein AAGA67_12900, partial [Cyanobacteria bacterium P01_F01_bin.153]
FWDFPALTLRLKTGQSPDESYVSNIRGHLGSTILDPEDEACKEGFITGIVEDPYRPRLHLGRDNRGANFYWDLVTNKWVNYAGESGNLMGLTDRPSYGDGGLGARELMMSRDGEVMVGVWGRGYRAWSGYLAWQLSMDDQGRYKESKNPRKLYSGGIRELEKKTQSKSDSIHLRSWTISNDGQITYFAYGSGEIEQWKTYGAKSLGLLQGHQESVKVMTMSPDGKILASGDWDGCIKLWEPSTRTELLSINAHNGSISDLVFSADGTFFASTSAKDGVKFWGKPGSLNGV